VIASHEVNTFVDFVSIYNERDRKDMLQLYRSMFRDHFLFSYKTCQLDCFL